MSAYDSLTTPGVQHTPECAFVEIVLLKEHGSIPEYPWRKASGFHKKWNSKMSLLMKLLRDHDITPHELLYLILEKKLRPDKFSWSNVGLVKWHINNSFYERVLLSEVIDNLKEQYCPASKPSVSQEPKVKSIKDLARRKNA